MNYLRSLLCITLLAGLMPHLLFAQLPPLQPEQDCFNALSVCQAVYVQPNSYQGQGVLPDEIDSTTSCLGTGEENDVWYILTVQTAGNLAFTLNPSDPTDDYDWAVYNLTNASCSDIFSTPALEVSCNWSGTTGPTGPNGQIGGAFEPVIPVTAGQTFVVNVSNFSASPNGYTLDFSASTAGILDTIPPQLDPVRVNCDGDSLEVVFSENVLCSSVQASDFTLTGPGGPYTITSVTSSTCQAGGTFGQVFSLSVSPAATQSGFYSLSLVDTVFDNCGNVGLFTTENFQQDQPQFTVSASPDTICAGQPSTLNNSLTGSPGYTFLWNPGNLAQANPVVTPATSTDYVLAVTSASGCIARDTVRVTVKQLPQAVILFPAQACAGQPTTISFGGVVSANALFQWDFDNPDSLVGSGAGPYGVIWNNPGTKTISLTVTDDGCVGPLNSQTIDVKEVPTSVFVGPASICAGDTAIYTYQGNAPATANFAWTFAGASYVENLGSSGTLGPYKVAWNSAGPRDVCLLVDNDGCISTQTCLTVDVKGKPKAGIAQVADQCFGNNCFTFLYTGDTDVDSLVFWNFGSDAQPPTSNSLTPGSICYQFPGEKTVSLVVSRDGCISDTTSITFELIPNPSATFSLSSSNICEGECITINYVGPAVGPNQAYAWSFGAGALPQSSSLENPGCIPYVTGGLKTISLDVTYKGCVTTATQQITVNAKPVASAGPDKTFCEGDGGVMLQGSLQGGSGQNFITWTCDQPGGCGLSANNILNPVANPAVGSSPDTITYCLQVTDVNGCVSNTDCMEVIVKPKPIMDAGADVSICKDGPGAFLNGGLAANNAAPAPITFKWIPTAGLSDSLVANPFARPDTTTIYTLVGSSANGCNSEVNTLDTLSTVTVFVVPKPIANAGPDTAVCLGQSVLLQGFGSQSGPTYTYSWTPALTGTINDPTLAAPTVSPTFTTTFSLVVTSNGCDSDADQVTVTVGTTPTLNPGSSPSICVGDSVQLDGRAAGDLGASDYDYQWSPAIGLNDPQSAKPLASPPQSTTYTLTATSPFGCGAASEQIVVTVDPTPIADILNADTLICQGDSLSLTATHSFPFGGGNPIIYRWTPENQILEGTNTPDIRISPNQTTLYEVETSIAGKCPTTDQILITVTPAVSLDLRADTTTACGGDSVQLTAVVAGGNATSPNYLYTWTPSGGLSNPGIGNPLASPDTSVVYHLRVQEGACFAEDSVALRIFPQPEADYFTSQATGCEGMEVNFLPNSPNALSYQWDFGDGSPVSNEENPTHVYNSVGSYAVTLTTVGEGGCISSVQKVTIEVSAASAADFTSVPPAGTELLLPDTRVDFTDLSAEPVGWYWDFGDGQVSSEQNPDHTYQAPGSYQVSLTVTDVNGCVSTLVLGPYIVLAPDLFVPNVFSPNADGINDVFRVEYRGVESYDIQIFDRWGREVFLSNVPDEPWDGIDPQGNRVNEGVFYYALKIGNQHYQGSITLVR
ncbi:MAG: PKD domain-containing protein [Bacteroidota bacterium]